MKHINSQHFRFFWITFISGFIFLATSCTSCNNEEEVPENLPKVDLNIFREADSIIIAQKAEELDKRFQRLVKLTGFNGTVLYTEKGKVVLKKAYGYQNVRRKRDSLSTSDPFQLASVSKMFTAMAVMMLKNEGQLNYEDDIRKYIPEFPYEGVTVRMLLTHRSGLPRYMSIAQDHWSNKKIPLNNDEVIDLFVTHRPDPYFKPGDGFHYCNTNYALLVNIVEEISGKHFENFMKERIFEPLDMDSSFIYQMRDDTIVSLYVEEGVPGYYHRGWRWREMTNDYLNGVMGDKGVYTSVDDLYKYDLALDHFTLLPDSVLKEAFEPGSPTYWRRKNNYGFGWRIKDDMDSTVYHFGWWKGFRTFYIRDMKHQKTLIVLTNRDKGPGSDNFWNIIKSDTLPLGNYSLYPGRR
ncbi:MAG: serine hydrolase domain-containing protein [Bacteroidales bacterium]|jgi:CubicO group peptidase (beta-lactamase class C family)|nr:serine hydrolase domain-containing protein [Bacteroidales bacterium]